MLITIDFTSNEPIYMQIRNVIVAGIATGALHDGDSRHNICSDMGSCRLYIDHPAVAVQKKRSVGVVFGSDDFLNNKKAEHKICSAFLLL